MRPSLIRGIIAVVLAIGITAAMDGTGLTAFSALPLCPLALVLWSIERFPRRAVGVTLGSPRFYWVAIIYPVVLIGVCAIAALAMSAATLAGLSWSKTGRDIGVVAAATIVVALLTEEGFFRGALWAALVRGGLSTTSVLVLTSIAFALWHISAVTLATGFDLPARQVPIFLINAAVMGAIWGLLRHLSGSIVVSSVAHGVWNGLAYSLFAYGTKVGALGVHRVGIFGPEVGVLGLALNTATLVVLWRFARTMAQRVVGGG
jgi:membrane protease YdiL (CAAX protease family)